MSIELRELRCFVAIVERGSFTDAAIELRMSQAAVSRNLASLERKLGIRLLGRTTRRLELTAGGERALRQARRVLSGVDELERGARSENSVVRIGYAWSALGRHTVPFQRRWAAAHPDIELELARSNTATAGLADGTAQLAILRRPPPTDDYDLVLIGLEKRVCAMAADDPWAKRRSVTLAEIAQRTVAIDAATGTTTLALWPESAPPRATSTAGPASSTVRCATLRRSRYTSRGAEPNRHATATRWSSFSSTCTARDLHRENDEGPATEVTGPSFCDYLWS
jgi:DNA-binding transcriptional LysR family regulator